MTPERINEIYADVILERTKGNISKLLPEYIRYLVKVDKYLWTPTAIENEFGLCQATISNLLRSPTGKQIKVERRKGKDRRKK